MLWIHPLLQAVATLLALNVAYLGVERFAGRHLGARRTFLWKRHVRLGLIAELLWLGGLVGGLLMVRMSWSANFVTGNHYKVAFAMLPFMALSMGTGLFMNSNRKKRTLLPLVHGAAGGILLLMALYQVVSGWRVVQDFLL
ncbi:DUF4079 family protein [Pseudodesulfovibrio senegalensis]|jgi:hypothetical protein|uniref:DUF4079 family protein n=1 Tax=Pseudodesulfovibrio senegalensis TaxID=1721087 RepID=A0A6N6N200_9BACT|nr:DUF4079 family protein [Pseudodesulfovibrio senegalensis]KAB1440890.1 DUF4079 family protein [Pseudodesulfovibrio senegalensis]